MTEEEYHELLAIAASLITVDPTPESLYGKRLNQIVPLLEDYERTHFPEVTPDREMRSQIIRNLARKHRAT